MSLKMTKYQMKFAINKKRIPKMRGKDGKCLVCNKTLSQYNMSKYCFNHRSTQVHHDDLMEEKRIEDQKRYYNQRARDKKNGNN